MVATAPPPAIRVAVNDRVLPVAPIEERGRVLVPMRAMFEALGARVSYDASTAAVDAASSEHRIHLVIGSPQATVDGRVVSLDVPARTVADRAYVPLRFVSTALGAQVGFDARTQIVNVTTVQYVAFRSPTVTYGEMPTPPAPLQSSDGFAYDAASSLRLEVGGRWFAPGSPIVVRLTAPPGGRAFAFLCTSSWRYEMYAAPDSPFYSTTLYAPRSERIDSCPITAMYESWNGNAIYSQYPIFVQFPGPTILGPSIAGSPTPLPTIRPIPRMTTEPRATPPAEPRKVRPIPDIRRTPPPSSAR